ncbi:MAG: RNA-binding protein [Thermodesulfobacteriota bacterium]
MDKTITFSEDRVTLFIGNLPFRLGEADVRSLLTPYGTVYTAKLLTHPESGESQGICFVEMAPHAAQAVIAALDGVAYAGRTLSVRVVTKEDVEDTQPV